MENQQKTAGSFARSSKQRLASPIEGLFCLYGQHDTGKSTALAWLVFSLAYDELTESEIYDKFESERQQRAACRKNRTDAFPDMRVIVPYKGIYVYLALYGDSKEQIENNVKFFEGSLGIGTISIFDRGELRNLKSEERNYHNLFPPTICVSACFWGAKQEEPLRRFMDEKHRHNSIATWVQIPKDLKTDSEEFKTKFKQYGKLLKRMIDESLIHNN